MNKLFILFYVLTTSSALIALKIGTKAGAPLTIANEKLAFNINTMTVLGIFLYGTSFLLYTFLIAKYDLGYIIPLATALVYVVIFFASYIVFKEVFTPLKIAGIVLIVAGAVLLNIKS